MRASLMNDFWTIDTYLVQVPKERKTFGAHTHLTEAALLIANRFAFLCLKLVTEVNAGERG